MERNYVIVTLCIVTSVRGNLAKAASPPRTDYSVVLASWRQCP